MLKSLFFRGRALAIMAAFALAAAIAATMQIPTAMGQSTASDDMDAAAYEADISLSENIGRAVYDRDTAAYLAATTLQETYSQDELGWLDGWITIREGEEYKVMFIGRGNGEPRAYFIAFVHGMSVYDSFAPPGGMPLSDREGGYWRARQDALTRESQGCSSQYNPVILPYRGRDGGQGGLFVYLVPASTDGGLIKAGGYELFDYSTDGRTLKGDMPFNTNCLDVEKTDSEDENLILSHSLTPYPQEHHVYLSLLYGTDVYVVTTQNNFVWKVSGGEVSFYETRR